MWEVIKSIFIALTSINRVIEKVTPSKEIQEANHKRKEPRMEVTELNRIISNSKNFLAINRNVDVDDYCLLHFKEYDEKDYDAILRSLKNAFPNRDKRLEKRSLKWHG